VAGLSAATVVVEARESSGALITADLALEEGRDVFAVPGEITSALSAGTNALLRLGAVPLTSAGDVLSALGFDSEVAEPVVDVTGPAGDVLARIRDAPAGADELVRVTGRTAGEVAVALSELELAGLVREADGLFRVAR
jgi:DNA processing protein